MIENQLRKNLHPAEQGLDIVILHPIIVIGPYDYNNYSEIYKTVKSNPIKIVFPGKIVFNHAVDVARAHILAYEKGKNCERYVLDGPYTTWLELFQKIALIVGAKPAIKATPKLFLKLIALGFEILSQFTGKKPLLSYEVVGLLENAPDVTYYEKRKTQVDLGYTSRSLDEMIQDSYQWLVSERLI